MIIWLNGTHGAGKTTIGALVDTTALTPEQAARRIVAMVGG
ncbi:hypothetical protein GCM10009867_06070 [Pedococcus aerophilus]|uniref:ATP-binding protein n=1 Tax=Pedococcus aerophilus TaxID=436356 RepID=A0ABN3UGI4_9MICO